ncbi:hypothetical protein CPC08DRAFT_717786 [Agrocybe pediades]|nr:hypothetical protein CPC08DRAFT_717786 [Agrocybe pediades]
MSVIPVVSGGNLYDPGIFQPYLSTYLNSQLRCQFLFGIYTGVFAVTILMYRHQENRITSSKTIIVGSMAALYVLTTITVAMNWYSTAERFCTNGSSRADMFSDISTMTTSIWWYVLSIIAGPSVRFIIADGVLVWRCFHACGQSFRSSALPIGLLILETALIICNNVVSSLVTYEPQIFHAPGDLTLVSVSTILEGAVLVSVAVTSLAATFIICRQVYMHTKPGSRSRRRYRKVIDALIQSSALYSSVIVVEAVLYIVEGLPSSLKPTTPQNMNPRIVLGFFDGVVAFVTGIAPTLMVARLIASSYNEDTEVFSANGNLEDPRTETKESLSLRFGEADGDSVFTDFTDQ